MAQVKTADSNVFVSSMYGAHTKKGMVQMQVDDFQIQLSVIDAQKVAHLILEAAQGALTDEAIFKFFEAMPGDEKEKQEAYKVGASIVSAIREKQNRNDQRIFDN